ncbi:hypothetical protein MMC25_002649 [Agyrium rufum]|nr:hypothetical protein [Agyrium rufum]
MQQKWYGALAALTCLLSVAVAGEVPISQKNDEQDQCNGMYGKNAWGGNVDPYILVRFDNVTAQDATNNTVSLVIFEWADERLLGVSTPENTDGSKELICYDENAKAGLCTNEQIGQFLLQSNASTVSKNPMFTQAVDLRSAAPIMYPIKRTGYYCVWTYGFKADVYSGSVEFRNAYGELPGAQIPKLAFYGGLAIVYAVILALWAFLYVQNRHDILPVQNYITAMMIFLVVEELMTWGFYDYQNRHGDNAVNKVLLVITSILNAGRNSFSFFLLLIVCMGYGVVKPSLGKIMTYVRILAAAHFAFGVLYSVASLSVTPDNAGPLVLLVITPLAGTLTAFYVWTLNSLTYTMKDLMERKQTVKAGMYRKLWYCIVGSILVIFAFFFLNSFAFATVSDADFVPSNWKTRWFILDGWLNLVYLFDIAFVAYLWRPTVNNRRFAMSDELAQDDDGGFEIASFGGSEDDAEDIEAGGARSPRPQPPPKENSALGSDGAYDRPDPPPKPSQPRHSLDGETIFAVGEDGDKWSDDEDDEERHGLTKDRI